MKNKHPMTLGGWFSAIGLVLTSVGVLIAALFGL